MTELKPCPFCGGEAEIVIHDYFHNGHIEYGIECTKCATSGYQFWGTIEQARKAWNRRTQT